MRIALIGLVLFVLLFGMSAAVVQAVEAVDCTDYCRALSDPGTTDLESPTGQTCICNPLGNAGLTDILDRILNFLFNVAIVLAPVMVLISGIMFLTAAGSPNQVSRAKSILIWTVVGFAVILLSKGLIAVIHGIIGI